MGLIPEFSFSRLRDIVLSTTKTNEILFERLPLRQGERLDSELLNSAIEFWFANHRDDGPPEWSCFKPEQHPALLANIILYERYEGTRYLTRLIGDAIVDFLPTNHAGRYLDEVLPVERLNDVTMRLDRTFVDCLPNYVEKAKVWQLSGSSYDYNALSLPFITRETGCERVLCILEFNVDRTPL